MNTRLLLISHAATAAMRHGRFPGDDALDARARAEIASWRERFTPDAHALALCSPARRASETAQALGLTVQTAPELADTDYGAWQGCELADIAATAAPAMMAWVREPEVAPPGGESFEQVRARVGKWLDSLEHLAHARTILAVTHAAVMRAAILHALGAPSASFAAIEIAPLSVVELRYGGRGWTWWAARAA